MRSRYPSASSFAYSFGPGPLTPAIKALIIANVAVFALCWFRIVSAENLGLSPQRTLEQFRLWEPFAYMFVHERIGHILFNMLALWMFGVELERMWGTRYFLKYYFVAGVGAALTTIALSFAPFEPLSQIYRIPTIGASGAIYGVLLAYGLYFPNRPVYLWAIFPVPAKVLVMVMGAISFFLSFGSGGDGVAHATHLGGLVAGYLYLKGGRVHVISEIKYRYLKWRINRMRKRFDVYSGGRADDVNRRVH